MNPKTFFSKKSLEDIYSEIKRVYSTYKRPWIIGFSGGKDSTLTLQLVWEALAQLPKEELSNQVYVIASDTGVENPLITQLIEKHISAINKTAPEQSLPISAHKVTPTVNDSFWVNLIGRGYPAPTSMFRWCTERMKIRPTNQFIRDKVSHFGEVIVVLGVRKAESITREQLINTYQIKGEALSRHSTLSGAYVYTPIVDLETEEVWDYLKYSQSPWEEDNSKLVELYAKANANERPMVIDETTEATGNGRFGCWVCTVASKDASMESLVEQPEYFWMSRLLQFRNELFETTKKERKHEFRDHKGRDGRVIYRLNKPVARTYKFEYSYYLFTSLLKLDKELKRTGDLSLISKDEILEIRRIWKTERQDWHDSAKKAYENIYGKDSGMFWPEDDNHNFDSIQRTLLEEACKEHDIPPGLLAKLLEEERKTIGLARRTKIFKAIGKILNEDWRSDEEIIADKEDAITKKITAFKEKATTCAS